MNYSKHITLTSAWAFISSTAANLGSSESALSHLLMACQNLPCSASAVPSLLSRSTNALLSSSAATRRRFATLIQSNSQSTFITKYPNIRYVKRAFD